MDTSSASGEDTGPEPRDDKLFVQGHTMCPGCGVAIAVNHVMDVLGEETVVLFSPGCLSAASTIEDNYRFRVPSSHMGLVHSASFAAGVSAGLEQLGVEDATVAPLAGDGATGDIGLQALSAAAERNDDVLYVCHDNEAYANTGVQGSATTPQGASTSTTPSGIAAPYGKAERKKDLFKIVTDHDVPYAATATPGYLGDMKEKLRRAKETDGFRFVQLFDPCPEGWKFDASKTVEVSKLAVQTGMWVLAESEYGEIEVTRKPAEREPVEAYLELQDRFKHLDDEEVAAIQAAVDDYWDDYVGGG
ncbi:MAG: thiamine pyrophosphate-dependent enzyme [Halobacteriales archaeon]